MNPVTKKKGSLVSVLVIGGLAIVAVLCLSGLVTNLNSANQSAQQTSSSTLTLPSSSSNKFVPFTQQPANTALSSLPSYNSLSGNPATQPVSNTLPSNLISTSPPQSRLELTAPLGHNPVILSSMETILHQKYPCLPHNPFETATVLRVVDGDTIRIMLKGKNIPLRYIGIDAPEDTQTIEPFGKQAFERNKQLVDGKSIFLIKDASYTDQYDRLLRYVLFNEEFINLILVKDGYAKARKYPPDTACASLFQQAQHEAQQNHLGLWGLPKLDNFTPTMNSSPTSFQCDPSYPTVCIPPSSPELDCDDIPYRNFKVLPPDPQHFDLDGNGFGCE